MNKIVQPQWLEWAKELQFIAQGGLTYSKDVFDIERFERIREIAAEMLSLQSEIPIEKVKNLFCNETGFQTPKLDTRAAIFKDDKILRRTRQTLWRAVQMLTQKLSCQTIHDLSLIHI